MNMKKNMRRILAFAAMAMGMMGTVAVVGACSSGMANSSVSINSTVDFSQSDLVQKSFTKIEVETVADVYYTQNNGSKESVRFDFSQIKDAKLRQQYQEKTVAIYRDGKVIIGLKKNISGSKQLDQDSRLRVYITSPDLVKVTMEGVGYFHSDAINSDTFTIDNEGVGDIDIKSLLANKVTIDKEGVGPIHPRRRGQHSSLGSHSPVLQAEGRRGQHPRFRLEGPGQVKFPPCLIKEHIPSPLSRGISLYNSRACKM